jgi:site-specific DNA-methyltransferase (adenine-specific)
MLPFDKLWIHYKRLIKENGAIVLTANQPFTSLLITSNLSWFKYCWVWDKVRPSGFQIAKFRPMMRHEDVCVFGKARVNYYPIMEKREKEIRGKVYGGSESSPLSYNDGEVRTYTHKYPQSILEIKKENTRLHPTQKPVALGEYLIETYSKEGDIILDNCMGVGSFGVAAKKLNRNFIGIEKEKKYFDITIERINNVVL